MKSTYESALRELALEDERLMVLTAENRASIRGLPAVLGSRFIDTGITEQTMIGLAAGLALRGRIPVAHALAAFLTMRPFEFIRTDVGLPALPVKLVGSVPGVMSEANGPTHQALEDVGLMRGIPNMRVFCPADLQDLAIGLPHVIRDPAPWYIRYVDRPTVFEHDPNFRIGAAEVVTDGNDVAILVYGALFREAHQAANLLAADGLSVRLLNLRTIEPIDRDAVIESAKRTRLLVLVEDHFSTGGLPSIVGELLLEERLTARTLTIGFGRRWFTPGLLDDVLRVEQLTPADLAARIRRALETPSHA
ncbi:MAG: transketolase [Gemmatimonadales bacterium]|nr:transketolase [Gemmatimonadales bacterium]